MTKVAGSSLRASSVTERARRRPFSCSGKMRLRMIKLMKNPMRIGASRTRCSDLESIKIAQDARRGRAYQISPLSRKYEERNILMFFSVSSKNASIRESLSSRKYSLRSCRSSSERSVLRGG